MLEVAGKRIGIIHSTEYEPGLEEILKTEFKDYDVDAIVYGHVREPNIQKLDDVLLLTPGQAYRSFMTQASIGMLTIKEEIEGEIKFF